MYSSIIYCQRKSLGIINIINSVSNPNKKYTLTLLQHFYCIFIFL